MLDADRTVTPLAAPDASVRVIDPAALTPDGAGPQYPVT